MAIQELIAASLRPSGYEVTRASDAGTALERIREALPDLVLLDWMLPGMSGIQMLHHLRADQRTRTLPVILLTARGEEVDKVAGFAAGTDDYLAKPFSARELRARITAVLRRCAPEKTSETVAFGGLELDPETRRVSAGDEAIPLGPSEFRLLHFFMTHPERAYQRAQLLDQVWGDHIYIEERTVDVHIRRLRSALAATGHEHLIQTVRGVGYRCSVRPE